MTDTALPFPPSFLWGTATAAHQVEGYNTQNDWWAFEQRPGAIYHGHRSGRACDWWANAEQDFDLMAAMGHNSHRLSVEWSRIEPQEGRFDPEAIACYRAMLGGLRRRGIEPMVTLFHFSSPLWLARQGGWQNPAVVPLFRRFVRHTVQELGDLVRLWCTINEPNVYAALGHLFGEHPPGVKSVPAYFRALRLQLLAHAAAYRVIHALDGRAQVGLVKNVPIFEPAGRGAAIPARIVDHLFNEVTLRAVQDGRLSWPLSAVPVTHGALGDSIDFVGVNYYTRWLVGLRPGNRGLLHPRPGAECSDCGRGGTYGEIYPAGMRRVLARVARLGKPIYVTENGLPDADDDQRPCFLLTHLAEMHRAMAQGADVRGYYHWTFVDNFEWSEGWNLRFGLVALDPETQARTPRRSAELFSRIARQNAITPEMVQEFAPEAGEQVWRRA
ncbi:MAG: glycoside hydrolase family 1 protein [Chloroflexi bacterium]|nr:MAG: glycoside hydrolase family 1 protein [Chloroflexota bacterium]